MEIMGKQIDPPFWKGPNVIKEPVLFFEDQGLLTGNLLYPPKSIESIEVYSPDIGYRPIHSFEIIKSEGKNLGGILTLKSQDLPFLRKDQLILPLGAPDSYKSTRDGKKGLIFSEKGLFHQKQVLITYTHETEWKGFLPQSHPDHLPRTKAIIQNGGELNFFIFGDSISTGANASKLLKIPPFQPAYPELLGDWLYRLNPTSKLKIKMINESQGGKDSQWGAKEIESILLHGGFIFNFDLNIIAWGANDAAGKQNPRKYRKNIETQIKTILKRNPNAEFIVVASSQMNELWSATHNEILVKYKKELDVLAEKFPKILDVADCTTLWGELLQRKSYYDLTGNGLNHPNDFGHQLYAYLIGTLVGIMF